MTPMDIERRQHEALKALLAFNNAVTTSRLYPATSPQVTNAVEKAYQSIKSFSRTFGPLSFSVSEQGPLLCGHPAVDQIGDEIRNLVVYRHLDLLKLQHVLLRPSFDRQMFAAILTIFSARKEKIAREGGGRPYADSLGLASYFPDECPAPPAAAPPAQPGTSVLPVELEPAFSGLLDALFSTTMQPGSAEQVTALLRDADQGKRLVLAGIERLVREVTGPDGAVSASRVRGFTRFLQRIDAPLADDLQPAVADGVVAAVTQTGSAPLLALLYCQIFPEGFGSRLVTTLIESSANDLFDATMDCLKRWRDPATSTPGGAGADPAVVGTAMDMLMATGKGKLHLGRQRVQSLLKGGEEERRERRLQAGINALLNGSTAALRSEELLLQLPEEIAQRYRQAKDEEADRLIEIMAAEMFSGDDVLRRRLIRSLAMVGDSVLERKRWSMLDTLTGAFLSWIRESEEGDAVFEKTASFLQVAMVRACLGGAYERADQILHIFQNIRTGQLAKPAPIPALVGRIQDRSYHREMFEKLFVRFLESEGASKAGERLSMMGRPAATFLIDKLLQEEEPKDRLRIISLLAGMGPVILTVVLDKLPEPMPWYGKRNLIKLAGEVAGPEQVAAIIPFLRHEDLRVQREAFACIYTISKDQRNQALLAALKTAGETMLVQIVKALKRSTDDETIKQLAVLLEDQEHYSEGVREPLIREIIEALARSGSETGRSALQHFVDNRQKKANRKLDQQLFIDAEQAVRALLAERRGSSPTTTGLPGTTETAQKPRSPQPPAPAKADSLAERLRHLPETHQVKDLLAQGKQELAREAIMKMIARSVTKQRFQEAETLREWLIEVDPMALTEIIRAAELIEEEKISSIDKDQIEVWSELYEALTTEEFATFFHALQRALYQNEQYVVRQGDLQSGLYLINSGKVRITYRDKTGEVLVKTAGRGDIIGADTVFEASVWTVNVVCLARTEILRLTIETLLAWREDFPSLESKLHDFCMKFASLQPFFKTSGRDRRANKRHQISGRVTSLLLDSKGRETGIASKGELFDISQGGVSFYLRISQKKNARLLLGRSVRVVLPMEGAVDRQVGILGMIIAVRGHQAMENEYSVHVRFIEEIASVDLQAIIKACRSGFPS